MGITTLLLRKLYSDSKLGVPSKVCCGAISLTLASELIVLSVTASDNEFVASLPIEQPHIPHAVGNVPEYFNSMPVVASTASITHSSII